MNERRDSGDRHDIRFTEVVRISLALALLFVIELGMVMALT